MRGTLAINVALLLVPFLAFLVAELIHGSGVLAVVFAGLIIAWLAPRMTTAQSRQQAQAAWHFGVFLLNGALFVLIGLKVQNVVHEIPGRQIGWLLLVSVAAWAALGVVRYPFQLLMAPFSRPSPEHLANTTRQTRNRSRIVSTVAGFRGAVSLAIALSVPMTTVLSGPDATSPMSGAIATVPKDGAAAEVRPVALQMLATSDDIDMTQRSRSSVSRRRTG